MGTKSPKALVRLILRKYSSGSSTQRELVCPLMVVKEERQHLKVYLSSGFWGPWGLWIAPYQNFPSHMESENRISQVSGKKTGSQPKLYHCPAVGPELRSLPAQPHEVAYEMTLEKFNRKMSVLLFI